MDSNKLIEKELVRSLIKDDEDAFCELYALYKSKLLYFAMKFVKSKEFAEDVFQDTFTIIWQNRHSINPEDSFSAYVYTIVRNKIIDIMRRMESDKKIHDYILSQAIDLSEDNNEQVVENELTTLINQALNKLTNRQQQVFNMSRNKEMSHKEIAMELNISVYTVQEHISLALKAIKDHLKHYYSSYTGLIMLLLPLSS